MNTKIVYGIVGVLVIALIGLFLYGRNQASAPVVETYSQNGDLTNGVNAANSNTVAPENSNTAPETNTQTNKASNTNTAVNTNATESQGHYSDESDVEGDTQVQEVVYDGKTFTPATLTIKAGDIIVFSNTSGAPFWPLGTNSDYPEFNAGGAVAVGKTYQFKFIKVGTWGFADRGKPSIKGTIKVTQ